MVQEVYSTSKGDLWLGDKKPEQGGSFQRKEWKKGGTPHPKSKSGQLVTRKNPYHP